MRKVRKFPTNRSFFEYFGFEYKRMRVTDARSQIKEKLNKYVVDGNKIYLHPFDPYYRSLYAYAYNRSEHINEIIEELGYVRLYKEELPSNAMIYDWQSALSLGELNSKENYRLLLDELVVEEDKVYLPSSGQLYTKSGLSSVDESL